MNLRSNVTVIIPCYNDGQYIKHALQSIYNQTLLPEKIIIIDDGSNLSTKKVLATIQHPLVQVISQENKGVSAARNKAISLVQTNYIANLDADDYFESTFIEKAVQQLNDHNHLVAVSSYYNILKNKKVVDVIKPLGGALKDFIVINNCIANTMFRKSDWLAIGGFDEKMQRGYEDWEFWIAILKKRGGISIIPEVLSNYRIKKSSRDQTALKKHDFELRKYIYLKHREVYETHLDFYIFELLRQNSLLRSTTYRVKNSKEFIIGKKFLALLRWIKKILKSNE